LPPSQITLELLVNRPLLFAALAELSVDRLEHRLAVADDDPKLDPGGLRAAEGCV
jgi:hypothetical protein